MDIGITYFDRDDDDEEFDDGDGEDDEEEDLGQSQINRVQLLESFVQVFREQAQEGRGPSVKKPSTNQGTLRNAQGKVVLEQRPATKARPDV